MVQVGNQWRLTFQLDVGRGVNGTVLGADGDTRTFVFAFFGGNTLISFTPAMVTGTITGCSMGGSSLGPLPAPYNCQSSVLYMDPGYYGIPPCAATPFACIQSTAQCGSVGVETNNFTMFFDCIPDSMRAFGIEGSGNPLGGCYPDLDMLLDFTNINVPIVCPGRQAVAADSSCQGYLPDVQLLGQGVCPQAGYTQTPAIGSLIGGVGDSVLVYVHQMGLPPSSATCSLYVRVVDMTGPMMQCPVTQTFFVNSSCHYTIPDFSSMLVMADNCDPSPVVTGQTPASGTVLANSTTVQMIAIDNAGNQSTCAFAVTAADTIGPVMTCPGPQQLYLNANCFASLFNYTSLAFAQDNCSSSVQLTQSPPVGTAFQGNGVSTVTIIGTDNSNNTSSCTFQVTRVDTITPTITCPGPQTIALNANCEAILADLTLNATVVDNCPSNIQLNQSPVAGTMIAGPSTVQVTLSATDTGNNTATCTVAMTYIAGQLTDTIMASSLTACQGDTVSLEVVAGLGSYAWSTGSTNHAIDVNTTGWYWCDVNLSSNCGGRDSVYIDFLPSPQPILTVTGNMICANTFTTYQWYRDSMLLAGETNMCINDTVSGAYYCVVTDANGCTGSSAITTFVGIEGEASNSYSIFPIPTQDILHINFAQPIVKPGLILVYDMAGRVVYQQAFDRLKKEHSISVEGLAKGDYLLEVRTSTFSGMRKVMKLD